MNPDSPQFLAVIDMVRRTGAQTFELRFSDDQEPTVWMAIAAYHRGSTGCRSLMETSTPMTLEQPWTLTSPSVAFSINLSTEAPVCIVNVRQVFHLMPNIFPFRILSVGINMIQAPVKS